METKNTETRNPTFGFALLVFALVLVVVVGGLLAFDGNLATLLFLSWLVVIAAGYYLKHKFADMENMAYDMIRRVMQPIVILLSVGAMIGAWIAAGTLPALIYYGLALISPSVFLIVAYLLCSVCSLFTGTSWGTMGTAGLAMVGVGMSMGMNPGLVAGAVICGAYFGDKLSPLSDTTNLAPAVSGAKVMNHVKHMLWTTVPAYLITFIIYLVLGFQHGANVDMSVIDETMTAFSDIFNLGIIPLLPAILVLVLLLAGKPPVLSILLGAVLGAVIAIVYQGVDIATILSFLWNGYSVDSGVEFIDTLLNRGGINSMWSTIGVFISACGLGGMLNGLGILDALLTPVYAKIKTPKLLIPVTMIIGYISNAVGATLSFAIVMTGTLMQPLYRKMRLRPEVLSRTLEDSCTMSAFLIPWNTGAIYAASVLGVEPAQFIPFCFLGFITPLFSLLYAFTGFSVTYLDEGEEYGETSEYKFRPFKKKF